MSVIDEYLEPLPETERHELQRVREIVKRLVPDAQEVISYGMPVLKHKGKYLIGFCAFKNHMSIFPGPEAIEAIKEQLSGYRVAKGTIQFTLANPLPKDLIETIVRIRVAEIESSQSATK